MAHPQPLSTSPPASPPPVVAVSEVSKSYLVWSSPSARLRGPLLGRLGQLPFLPARLADECNRLSHQSFRRFYALRDVSVEVRSGETVGIVGRNGSGKSTLLEIVAGTVAPTAGEVRTQGRVAALLELGSGFNPEFTGRENVYLYGSILGLRPREIDRRYAEIAAFADIGDFLEQPLKTYSSGMAVRLAFAVAANVDADVLVIDEALAVGDEAFQRRCYDRLRRFQAQGGTILFVSHSASAVVDLCDRALLLDRGEVLLLGSPKDVIAYYHKLLYAPPEAVERIRTELRGTVPAPESPDTGPPRAPTTTDALAHYDPHLVPKTTVRYESRGAVADRPRVLTLTRDVVNVLSRRGEYLYEYEVEFTEGCHQVRFGMLIKSLTGIELGGAVSATHEGAVPYIARGTRVTPRFRFRCLLAPGVYFVNAGVTGVVNGAECYLHRVIDALMIRVQADDESLATGLVDLLITVEVAGHS